MPGLRRRRRQSPNPTEQAPSSHSEQARVGGDVDRLRFDPQDSYWTCDRIEALRTSLHEFNLVSMSVTFDVAFAIDLVFREYETTRRWTMRFRSVRCWQWQPDGEAAERPGDAAGQISCAEFHAPDTWTMNTIDGHLTIWGPAAEVVVEE